MTSIDEVAARTVSIALPLGATMYTIEPGGLYWITLPDVMTAREKDDFLASFKDTFAPGAQRLTPPAHFLVGHGSVVLTQSSDDDIRAMIARYQAILDDRAAEREAAPNEG